MAEPQTTCHTVNTTTERLDIAMSWLRANTDLPKRVGRDGAIMAAVGLLICNEDGHFTEAELMSAMADPCAISCAEMLLNAAVK